MPLSDLLRVPETDPVSIYRHRDGMYAADLLTAALVWLDLFSWLAEHPSNKTAICRHFGICERPTDVMLTLFTAMGFLHNDGGRFALTALAREHLVSGSPWCIAPYYAALKDRPLCKDFVTVLRSDRAAPWAGQSGHEDWHGAMEDAAFASQFTAAMDCRGVYLGQGLARSLNLQRHRHLLDVAGGSGVYACALLATQPGLRATVLEKPPVDRVAAATLVQRGCADRVDVHAADMLLGAWPMHADVHLLSNVLHDWGQDTVAQLLRHSFEALPPGGLLIVHDAFINAAKDGPLPVAAYSALLMHSTQGKCYSVAEYQSLLAGVGFVDIDYAPTVADRGRMVGFKPQRAHA